MSSSEPRSGHPGDSPLQRIGFWKRSPWSSPRMRTMSAFATSCEVAVRPQSSASFTGELHRISAESRARQHGALGLALWAAETARKFRSWAQ